MQEQDLAVIILAAGKGTRMENSLAKVLIPITGKPTLEFVLDTAERLIPPELLLWDIRLIVSRKYFLIEILNLCFRKNSWVPGMRLVKRNRLWRILKAGFLCYAVTCL